jgi:uncharacterized protein (DUF58 family)
VSPLPAPVQALRRWWRSVAFLPTRRLALALAAVAPLWLLGATAVGVWPALLALAALAIVAALDLARLPAASDLTVERFVERTIGVGDATELRYVVGSAWRLPLVVALHDALPAAHLSGGVDRVETALPSSGAAELTALVTGMARGQAELGDVALRVRTPLGLVARTLRYPREDRVLVAPSIAGVRRLRWLALHHRLAAAGVRDARRRGEGRSFASLRDYVVGDDPRHIDWKASARRGHPITREYTIEQAQTVYLLIDAGRSMTQLAGVYPRFEYALSSALVLADVAITAGDRVGAMVFDDRLRALVPAQRGPGALHALRSALIPLRASLVEPDYSSAFRALATRQRKRALLVMLTDVIDARAARALLAHLTHGASRHLAIVVALRNEAVARAASLAGSETLRSMYSSAAAEELLTERATALRRMRDAGIVVLDVAPDAMAAAVVNQYLELKARGAL